MIAQKKSGKWLRRSGEGRFELTDRSLAVLMISPSVILITAFAIYPVLQGLFASLFRIESTTLEMSFAGLNNYQELLGQRLFWE